MQVQVKEKKWRNTLTSDVRMSNYIVYVTLSYYHLDNFRETKSMSHDNSWRNSRTMYAHALQLTTFCNYLMKRVDKHQVIKCMKFYSPTAKSDRMNKLYNYLRSMLIQQ
jgi:hypothetical protein